MIRIIYRGIAAAALLAVLSASTTSAQEPPATADGVLCAPPDLTRVSRAVKLALEPGALAPSGGRQLIIAIVEPTGPQSQGIPVKVIQVIHGNFTAPSALADRSPTITCLSEGVWVPGQPVIGVFLVAGNEITTLVAVPFVNGKAVIGADRLTVDEVLKRARSFVEPTPTPLPPGVPPPPAVVPPASGMELPGSGGGSGGGTAGWLSAVLIGAAFVSLAGGLLVLHARRR